MSETPKLHEQEIAKEVAGQDQSEMSYEPTQRDTVEKKLKEIFGDSVLPTEKAHEGINKFKDGSYAMSEMGMMLYTNGYNLRGVSHEFANGMIYCDGKHIFGIGYFAKEGEKEGHLMIVAPKGENAAEAVDDFIKKVRASGIARSSIYIRGLNTNERKVFEREGMARIEVDPWHPEATEEDETFANRVFHLDEIIEVDSHGELANIKNLERGSKNVRRKNRLAYNRFENFMSPEKGNDLEFEIKPYVYSEEEQQEAEKVVKSFFAMKQEEGGVVGSTPEDYFSLIRQKPHGENGKDYFAYLAYLKESTDKSIPVSFFAGEKITDDKVGLYATITQRFPAYLDSEGAKLKTGNDTRYGAIAQYAWMRMLTKLKSGGINLVDVGGSETEGLDEQKKRLGGRRKKSYWLVKE